MQDYLVLFLAAFAMLGTPGPAPVALAASGAGFGWRASLPFYGGVMSGLVAAMALTAAGVAALIATSPALAVVLVGLSLGWVVWLAWRIAIAPPLDRAAAAAPAARPRFLDGFMINILNPKLYAAFATLFASFLPGGLERAAGMAVTGLTAFLIALVMNNFWILAGDGLAHLFSSPRQNRALRLILAGLMLLAVCLAVYKLVETGLPSGS